MYLIKSVTSCACFDADPLYINELDRINSLLHHKNMSGEVRISDSLLLSLQKRTYETESVSCRSQVVQ